MSTGETGDYSGAKYDRDFSKLLEEAHKAKHKFIADSFNNTKGSRVFNMACGWAPFTKYIVWEKGAESIGLHSHKGRQIHANSTLFFEKGLPHRRH